MEKKNGEEAREQYRDAGKLKQRISIHARYSVNKQGFGNWIFSHYALDRGCRVLEAGCGTGEMWRGNAEALPPDCEILLTDFSPGMLEEAEKNLNQYPQFRFAVMDIQAIHFADGSFDAAIANMMLYHVPDIDQGLRETKRVLKAGGRFYCATYGENGIMAYLSGLLGRFGVRDPLNRRFTLQNGEEQLKQVFPTVTRHDYPDALAVTDPEDVADYLYSMGSMTGLDPAFREEIVTALRKEMKDGVLTIPKEYGMFICE